MSELPSEAALYRLYEECRERYFRDGGACLLPPAGRVRIEWSNRLTSSAGVCYPKERIIRLSTFYHRAHPEEVESTLLHEMIHLLVPGHGPRFNEWVARIRSMGGRVARYARSRATAYEPPRWCYRCRRCGAELFRYRRMQGGGRNYVHRGCGGRLQEVRLRPT